MKQSPVLNSKTLSRLLAFALAVYFFSCKGDRVPGFKSAGGGIYYKLLALGESEHKAKAGEYQEMRVLSTFADSVIYDSRLESAAGTMLMPYNERPGFANLAEGDSALFLVPAFDLMNYGPDTLIKMRVKLLHILNEKQYETEMQKRTKRDEVDERVVLNYYLKRSKLNLSADGNGLFFIDQKAGQGAEVKKGDKVLINYSGCFLNGKKFDASPKPIEFTLGEEGQLLKGMALGLEKMKAGGKAKIIIPSQLAYGAEGSTTGIVQPFTTLIYEVELLKVN
jgi:FKBP-type peptidyl-prolyl cis-trans isomerase FkpA